MSKPKWRGPKKEKPRSVRHAAAAGSGCAGSPAAESSAAASELYVVQMQRRVRAARERPHEPRVCGDERQPLFGGQRHVDRVVDGDPVLESKEKCLDLDS